MKNKQVVWLNAAIAQAGGITALSRRLNLSGHSVIQQWRRTQVPAEHCPDLEEITGIACEKLRPDVNWSVLRKGVGKSNLSVCAS